MPVTRALVLLWVVLAAGACTRKLRADGTLAEVEITGPVDSHIARDYLAGGELPRDLQRLRATSLRDGTVPSRDALAAVAREYSPDVATLLFIESVAALPENRAFRDSYLAELADVHAAGIDGANISAAEDVLVLFVPGWFYVAHGTETGADFRRQRDLLTRLGVANDLVRIDENGRVDDNAETVAAAIRLHASTGRRIVLVSASKSGAEVALALGRELTAAETRPVVAWLSIGGVVRGSPFADRMLEPDLCWIAEAQLRREGFDLEGLRSMRTTPRHAAFSALDLPAHVLVVSYIAAPLSSHITSRGDFGYARMRKHGPNDGLTLLIDELLPGALALVEPGVDHFFVDDDHDIRTVTLLRVLLEKAR
jgi:hypothetical protein